MKSNLVKNMAKCLAATGLVFAMVTSASATAIRLNTGFSSNSLAANDDSSTGLISFGFTVDFFGNMRSGGYVNNNGNVTLDSALGTYTPFNLATTGREIFAPFFADVDTTSFGSVATYGTDAVGGQSAFAANWVDVCYYSDSCNLRDSFQLVIIDRSDIGVGDFDFEFNIDSINWETGDFSGGFGGLGGDSARVGWSNGTTNSFELTGSAVNGAFLDSGPAGTSLINNELNSSFSVGGMTLGRYLFQVRNGNVQQQATGSTPPTGVPEPAPLALLGFGLLGLGVMRKRRG